MTTEEAIRILYEMLSKTFNGGGELGGLAVQMAVEALRKQEEPVSEDLEEAKETQWAAMEYTSSVAKSSTSVRDWCTNDVVDAFKAGAKWDKQQMLKDAVERVVKVDAGGYPYIDNTELYDYTEDRPLAKAGDKVKIVVIKED